jgi:hypothetical protein
VKVGLNSLTSWSIHGSIDSTNWLLIQSKNEELGSLSEKQYSCQSNQYFNFIKFTFNAPSYDEVRIRQIELGGKLLKI